MTPIRATWSFFSDVKNDVLARITERSKDDYDNDVSDNCDHNFGTFDDFGVKNDQKVSNNMILMSKYKGKHGGKKGSKIRAGVSLVVTFPNTLRQLLASDSRHPGDMRLPRLPGRYQRIDVFCHMGCGYSWIDDWGTVNGFDI